MIFFFFFCAFRCILLNVKEVERGKIKEKGLQKQHPDCIHPHSFAFHPRSQNIKVVLFPMIGFQELCVLQRTSDGHYFETSRVSEEAYNSDVLFADILIF